MAGKKILIIEDETLQLTITAKRLKAAGYEIAAARDGTSAISEARKEHPDLILLDLGLPAGDGFLVLQRLQMILQTAMIPVIVLSARTPEGNKEAVLKGGAVAYLQKPVDTEVLLKAVADALGLPAPDSPPQQP
jgi:DNA-binding response OmpR family regulator